MEIRPINPESETELALVAERMRLTLVDAMGEEKGASYYSPEWLLDRVRWHINLRERAEIFLCEDENHGIIAQAIVRIEHDTDIHDTEFAYFSTIYVEPLWRRKGVARKLIKRAHSWSRCMGLDKITYSTASNHRALLSLLPQFGYEIIIESGDMIRLAARL